MTARRTILAALGATLLLGACTKTVYAPSPPTSATPAGHNITVVVAIAGMNLSAYRANALNTKDGKCLAVNGSGTGQAKTIVSETVTISNGTVDLGAGTFPNKGAWTGGLVNGTCRFSTMIPNVPDAAVYTVTFDGFNPIHFSATKLAAANWTAVVPYA